MRGDYTIEAGKETLLGLKHGNCFCKAITKVVVHKTKVVITFTDQEDEEFTITV